MSDKALAVFTIGQGKAIPVDHTGPASYATGGETYGNINAQTGITTQGLGVLDRVIGGASVSGNYYVYVLPVGAGERKTVKLVWVTATSGIPTTTQVTSTTNLSAETVPLLVIGR